MTSEGPVKAIIFGEFDTQAGPKIAFQCPEGSVPPEAWDAVFEYVIAKPQLCGHMLSVAAHGLRIAGVPTCINDTKYSRNAYVFNVAVVLPEDATPERLEPALQSLSSTLSDLERANGYLTREETRKSLESALPHIRNSLNSLARSPVGGECTVPLPGTEERPLTFKVPAAANAPSDMQQSATESGGGATKAEDEDDETADGQLLWKVPGVPISVVNELGHRASELYEHVDGVCSARDAARGANIDSREARKCVRELLQRNLVRLANRLTLAYVATPRVRELFADGAVGLRLRLLQRCFGPGAKFEDAAGAVSELRPGLTAQEIDRNGSFRERKVRDVDAFLAFCIAHGWILPMPEVLAVKEAACSAATAPSLSSLSHSALRDPRAQLRNFV